MTMGTFQNRAIMHSFPFPLYQVKIVGPNAVLIAGGGGASKTGVPNCIQLVQLTRPAFSSITTAEALIPTAVKIVGSLDTNSEAVMHMELPVWLNGSERTGAGIVFSLEGSTCREYLLCDGQRLSKAASTLQCNGDVFCEQGFKIFSSTSDRLESNGPTSDSSLSSGTDSDTLVLRRNPSDDDECASRLSAQAVEVEPADAGWSFNLLRQVCVTASTELMQRRRRDSYSSTSGQLAPEFSEDELNCLAVGGPGQAWCALGTAHGGVVFLDRYNTTFEAPPSRGTNSHSLDVSYAFGFGDEEMDAPACIPLSPFHVLMDASGNQCAPVCDVAFSVTLHSSDTAIGDHDNCGPLVGSLFASISGRPLGSLLRIWKIWRASYSPADGLTSKQPNTKADTKGVRFFSPPEQGCSLYAEVQLSTVQSQINEAWPRVGGLQSYRFRHCAFLRWMPDLGPSRQALLVTSEQPVRCNCRSLCRLSVWLVPLARDTSQSRLGQKGTQALVHLERLASASLPRGQLPACIATYPSRNHGLIALGTMEGRVDVYVVSLRQKSLFCVYTLPNAHPIFVTSLAFLPFRENLMGAPKAAPDDDARHRLPLHYELVSVSVDRVLRWHPGPSVEFACRVAEQGLPSSFIRPLLSVIRLVCLLSFACFLPFLLIGVDSLLSLLF